MKIVCTQENLKAGVSTVARIISGSNTLPILNNLLLKTENGLLYIIATNLELAISTTIRCKIEAEGSICLPAKTMLDLVQNLPAENITIEKVDQGVSIVAEHFKTKLVSLPTDEFPTVPKIEPTHTVNIDGGELKQILESVVFAAATTETQPEISGVLMRLKERELICV